MGYMSIGTICSTSRPCCSVDTVTHRLLYCSLFSFLYVSADIEVGEEAEHEDHVACQKVDPPYGELAGSPMAKETV